MKPRVKCPVCGKWSGVDMATAPETTPQTAIDQKVVAAYPFSLCRLVVKSPKPIEEALRLAAETFMATSEKEKK